MDGLNWIFWGFLVTAAIVGIARHRPTSAESLLKQRVRGGIMKFLSQRPGSSITSICRNTQISWGTAQHHLYVLAKAGLVSSKPVGRNRAFFGGALNPRQAAVALLRIEPAWRISHAVLQRPGEMQKKLLATIGLSRKMFRHHVNVLVTAGLIVELKGPKIRTYQPGADLRSLVDEMTVKPTEGLSTTESPGEGPIGPEEDGPFADVPSDGPDESGLLP